MSRFTMVPGILRSANCAGLEGFDGSVFRQILAEENRSEGAAAIIEREAREWAEMFDIDSPFRSDLRDIEILAGRFA